MLDYDADIVCLQEVDAQYWETLFKPEMRKLQYEGIYKQRTGDKPDGTALFYKSHRFELLASKHIEYKHRTELDVRRDNVGVLGLLQFKDATGPCICIATTHLLFSPRRGLVKLAQIQCLAEEAAFLASLGEAFGMRVPVIVTGDMNFTPDSLLYEYLIRGRPAN